MQQILFLFFVLICNTVLAQNDTLNLIGQITFKEKYITLDGREDYFKSYLTFNENESLKTSHKYGIEDGNGSAIASHNGSVSVAPDIYDEKGFQIYRNLQTKELIIRTKEYKPFPAYIVKDNWVEIKWEIRDEYKNIENYRVQKAVGTFRGREWTVWFTNGIPLPFGPNKLYGLPGIILEAKDKDYHIIASNICYPCDVKKVEKIIKPSEKVVRTIEEEVLIQDNRSVFSILERHKQNNFGLTLRDAPTESSIWAKRQKAMEIIYEWEDKNTKRVLKDKEKINEALGNKRTFKKEPQILD